MNKNLSLLKGFDADWYLAEYPDVAELGMKPHEHFLWIGGRLGRKPGPNINLTADEIAQFHKAADIKRVSASHIDSSKFRVGRVPAIFINDGDASVDKSFAASIAVHAHLYYPDLAPEFASFLNRMPYSFDLFVSVPDEGAKSKVIFDFREIHNLGKLDVRIVPNVGRDISPFVVEFAKELSGYDICAHIQSKKSLYNQGATDGWRQYILNSLFESSERIAYLLHSLDRGRFGIIYPQTYYNIPYMAHTWLANSGLARQFSPRLGLSGLPDGYFDFPAGSMFWAKTDAIRPLLEAGLDWPDFPPEQGQTDGTLAHCIERMLGLVPASRHFQHGVIRDKLTPSWSRWRLNQFLDRPLQHLHDAITHPTTKVVAFDIFDTLITRPLLDADYVKSILNTEYAAAGHQGFLSARASHEEAARNAKGADVNIHEIYDSLLKASFNAELLSKEREIDLEVKTVRPRNDVINLFNFARLAGKRVILISDMFLPQDAIEAMLEKCGISGWDHFYLSCEVGLRKDSGKLYQHVLNHENVSPSEIVMFGDNERSDFQIPADLGLQAIHVMKPSNLLKAIPRFADLIPDARSASPGEQFVFGAIAAENFSSVSFPQFSADDMFRSAQQIGYGLLGPIVLSFCQWLERKVAEDGLKCLHFLAREGKFLKRAFDLWQRTRPHPTKTEYLLISRRAITVPCISEISDALDIASANDFYGASIESFLVERFGITLDDATWIEIERRKLWQRDQPLEIRNGSVEHLKPLIARIMPEIISEAQAERESALTYFKRMKLDNKESAVVDVGYGGTIQRHLIKLLGTEISGLYLVTDERGHDWGVQSGVSVNGCFVEGASRTPQASPMFLHSFLIEKMLSASDRQVMRYTGDGEIEFRDFQENEDKGADTRTEMQDAAIKFITEAATIRDDLLGEFTVSSKLCETLFARFSTHLSPNERRVFENLALDDFYCGRGIVN